MAIESRVRTAAGVVRGRWEDGVAVFRGIPYAAPPFGPRRFAAPVAAQRWDGVRDAVMFGPAVPQATNRGSVMSSVSGRTEDGSEDCLTLNVWSPDPGAAHLPVMVWIQGGTYLENNCANPHYDGAKLAASGVVLVSMNYRVGAEGFAHIAGAPDNRGILDQIAALRWVRDNIAVFGGDPDNVTVFGQSAGGACIAALLVMPSAAGLFRRAISQSMPGTYFSERLAAAISTTIAAQLGAEATVDELARIPPRALTDATAAVIRKMPDFVESWGPMALTPTPFSPVVDGILLPEAPWGAFARGAARDIDLLVGHTRDEFRLYTSRPGGAPTDARMTAAFDHLAPTADRDYRTAYPDATPSQRYELLNTDWLFRMPSLHLADAAHAGGGPVWLYELHWSFNREQGASHCLDFLLVFGTLGADEVRAHRSAHPNAANEITHVSADMRTDWVNFATTGEPGWAPYDPHARTTRVYDATPTARPYPEERSRRIWSSHEFGTLDLRTG
ncbi:para-nitrobenzyl esterase [Nocardia amikacinitolerans]|uniref:Carboxylic ester hydrolase n=1 Tax=Nocardia amikacinitolerans TaxID=756689 RepID=A0A285KVH1_9NOCA|nr:carboxylesterase family protein [Nocardia amikacinitolerans]SNY76654.1 para-nitrobenzyl esterase [Nocardia amikacinitolerans]